MNKILKKKKKLLLGYKALLVLQIMHLVAASLALICSQEKNELNFPFLTHLYSIKKIQSVCFF